MSSHTIQGPYFMGVAGLRPREARGALEHLCTEAGLTATPAHTEVACGQPRQGKTWELATKAVQQGCFRHMGVGVCSF